MSGKNALVALGIVALLTACGHNDKSNETPDSDYQRRLIERLIDLNARQLLAVQGRFRQADYLPITKKSRMMAD